MAQYNYQENGESKGPFSIEELKLKNITRQTLVWTQGMDSWSPAEKIEELNVLFESSTQVPPPISPSTASKVMDNQPQAELPPKTYLIESILVTCLCCMPFGIVGIINATKVEDLFRSGEAERAEAASREAKKWCKIGLITGAVVITLYVIFYACMFLFIEDYY